MKRTLATVVVVFMLIGAFCLACNGGKETKPTETAMPGISPTPIATKPAPTTPSIPTIIGYVNYGGRKYACYNETVVLSDLIRASVPFRDFYNAKRASMPMKILWLKDQYNILPFRVLAMTDTGNNITMLKNIPAKVEDSFIVAHELCSYLQEADGFDGPKATDLAKRTGNDSIAYSLGSMVSTLVRDKMLKPYYDLTKAYDFYLDGFLIEPAWPHSSLPDKVSWMTTYVQSMLYWKDLLGYESTSEFEIGFGEKYAEILADSEKMLSMVEANGYSTPQDWAKLFPNIIEEFKLGDWVT